ncbi:MAG TPA: MBL fold metallo-hydrolase [Methylomirabilota bacterium]|nr:MBL fold metallo-hydrolase [Methylomirabilota bacterium]
MKIGVLRMVWCVSAGLGTAATVQNLPAQGDLRFAIPQRLTNREVLLKLSAPTGEHFRVEASDFARGWHGFVTLRSTGINQHIDSGAPYTRARAFRAASVTSSNVLTGDHLVTDDGEVVIHPINHATFVMRWNDKMIYNDPVGAATLYQGLPRANLILVSHSHGDHFSSTTLDAVRTNSTMIVAPSAVFNGMSAALRSVTTVMSNGARTNLMGIGIEAVPAYNQNHPAGAGNGYVLNVGGRRLYMSGDTGNIPEMRALRDIDVAFVCMNVPFTMTVADAATAVRAFRPRVVYPYHYRNQGGTFSDLNDFKRRVGADLGIEVRLRNWY